MYKNNPLVSYRTPRVLSPSEIINCQNYIESQINEYLDDTNAKSFTVKDFPHLLQIFSRISILFAFLALEALD